ncbi:tetratricopeptide repeat protein [Paraburkholderia acidisoli]|uniref:Tetratricopeptide repeat protein n=1 Tax=Paraburkholderia acidisoli TaxID=2571748 RepID=A0A7Z2JGK4_9BURK|nr:tetratricopeptide repeat protein [Paraburkholderia acidisoli]QGZ63113.1 tetratricopeptide repeat protein [Paraburkholderia acidisoli]
MSMSPAAPERQRLFSPAVIAILGAFVTLLLALAFPREKLQQRLLGGANVDGLTIAYLEAWRRVDPNNGDVLSELTREYLKVQRPADAQRLLPQLAHSDDPAVRQMALAIRLSMAQNDLYSLKNDDPRRAARMAAFDALLREATHYTWNVDETKTLQQQAMGINDAATASVFIARLIEADPQHANTWRMAAARVSLASGDYRAASDAYFAAQAGAATRGERRTLFLAGVRALQSGNLLKQALDAANQHIGDLADDPETLRYLANLAVAAGRPDLATGYVKRLLKMSMRERGGVPGADGAYGAHVEYAVLHVRRVARESQDGRRWLRLEGLPAPTRLVADGVRLRRVATSAPQANGAANGATSGSASDPATAAAPASTTDEDLAYRVFLANGDVANAQRVAQRALDKAPDSMVWHNRLAQVAEWNHQPQVALQNWLALAQATNQENAWQQVARLAPGLDDTRAILAVAIHQAALDPSNLKQVDRVVAAYEGLGDPDSAMRFLAARQTGSMRQPILERSAELAERKGDDTLALQTWQTLERQYGPNANYAYRIATLLYARTQFDAALATLRDAQPAAHPQDADYWRFLTLLGAIDQNRKAVGAGYHGLMSGGQMKPDDYDSMISFYQNTPLDAGRLAEMAYRQSGQVKMLEQALYQYRRAYAWERITALLNSLTPQQRAAAEQSPTFLLSRAEYERQRGDFAAQSADIRGAAKLAPDNEQVRSTYVWSLVDRGTDVELRNALARYASYADSDPTLSAPFGAAYLRLGDGRAALHYLHLQAAGSKADPLWQLTWADALELNGRTDEAWQLRRRVWTDLARRRNDPHAAPLPPAERDDLRGRMVALSQHFANGDASRAVLIAMLREDRAASEDTSRAANAPSEFAQMSEFDKLPPEKQRALRQQQSTYSAIAREAAISWAQNGDASDLEHLWLEKQYIDKSTRPVYAEAQLAIDEGDVNTLDRLLTNTPDLVPRENRIDADALTGRYAQAQTDAVDAAARVPDNDVIQAPLREQLLRNAQSAAVTQRYVNTGPLRYNEQSATAGVRIGNNQSIQVRVMNREQSSDAAQLPVVSKNDRLEEGIYRHQGQNDEERVTIGRREALRSFTEAKVEGSVNVTRRLTLTYEAGYHQYANESPQLQVGGTKDYLAAGFNYRIDPHWFTGGRYEYAAFHGQDGSMLGHGQLVELNGGYKIRVDYPDYTVRAILAHSSYSASGTPGQALQQLLPAGVPVESASYMPQGSSQAGLLFSFGEDLTEGYSKAWRPFFVGGPVYDTHAGWTGQVLAGMAGSVFGDDQAVLYGAYQGVSATRSTSLKELGLRYRYLY